MYWNEPAETMDREKLVDLQTKRFQSLIETVYQKQPFYRNKMQEIGIMPQDISSLEDVSKLPFVIKQDMRDNYPYGMFAVSPKEIVRIHASSGTTGQPTVVGYTKRDIGVWSEIMARSFSAAGVDSSDYIQISYGYGLFTGGLGAHYGAELLGASVIPSSSGNTARQVLLMKDFGTTVLSCTPSYALYIGEKMQEMGIDIEKLPLKAGVFGAEPCSEEMRKRIEEVLKIKAYDIYGLSEIIGPGVACECSAQDGMHINEDHFYPEIINPETGEVLPEGSRGELVITTLTKEGVPMVRYRTRDITVLSRKPCSCGRTLVKMQKVLGRTDDMLIIRGVNVFPSQIENVLVSISDTTPNYQLIVDRINNLDKLTVVVELDDNMFSDEVRKVEQMERSIKSKLHDALNIGVDVRLVNFNTIERSEGKAKRVIDNRKI
ncbi:phenylacetate--CoA ligase [Selenomonadales bacterium OttesenSCG-928-I06]|nr:phenylacetate--CoA ligase [Selenomonadales bacterium OttesenSCG-928-I06]